MLKSKKTLGLAILGLSIAVPALALGGFYLSGLHHLTTIVSTVPNVNGDVNPYGVAIVPRTMGKLVRNNILVSNFNNSDNLQGTGTTIVQIWPNKARTLFAKLDPVALKLDPPRIGLTTALVALKNGWVIVGSLPTQDGTAATATDGHIFILNSNGKVVKILKGDKIHGPWDATALDRVSYAHLFVTMVLEGTVAASPNVVNNGSVVRFDLNTPLDNGSNAPTEVRRVVIASGFPQRTDPAALVIGPTGLAMPTSFVVAPRAGAFFFLPGDLLVANTLMNEIRTIHNPATRMTSAGLGDPFVRGNSLNQPLGLVATPLNSVLATNGGDGKIVEIGLFENHEIGSILINPNGAGTLFGLAVPLGNRLRLAPRAVYFVDDGQNTLRLLN